MNELENKIRLHPSVVVRYTLITIGFVFLTLGIVGAFVPILPTTVFILLASACFAKSSPRFFAYLLANKWFGPMVYHWNAHRCMSIKAKRCAISIITLCFSLTILLVVSNYYAKMALLLTGLILIISLWNIKTCRPSP